MRIIAPIVLLTVLLVALIGYRLRSQQQALAGPSGGSGEIEATTVDLSSRVGARINSLSVREGQHVHKGDLLVELDCSEPTAMVEEAKARVAAAEAQAEAAGANVGFTERSRLVAIAGQKAAQAQAAALGAQQQAAERQAARLESIPKDVPAASVDETRSTAIGLSHQVEAAKAQANASAAQVRAAKLQISASSANAEAAKAQLLAARAGLERAQLLVIECKIRAPLDAEVGSLPFEVGELTAPNSVLVRLLSLKQVKATFYLPNAEIGVVKPGARAIVVADAWPGEKFKAKVSTVSLEAEFTPRNIQTRTDRDRLVYPVEVVIENPKNKLRSGMPVQVTLPGTERARGSG